MSFSVHIDYDPSIRRGVIKSDIFDDIREHFSCTNKSRQMVDVKKRMFIPKRNYMITSTGKFDIGLLNEIFDYCVKRDSKILEEKRFTLTDMASYYYEPSFNVPENYTLPSFTDFRDIQIDAFKRIFKRGRGVIDVGTGGGKSYVIIGACDIILRYNPSSSVFIYVPSHLCKQLFDDFVNQGFKEDEQVSVWSSEYKDKTNFNAPILIGSMSMCIHKNNAKTFDAHCKNRNVCMIDECHRITVDEKNNPNATTKKIREMTTNNIIGFTGTVPISHEARWMCLGSIGKVIYKVTSKELKDKGHKAESKIVAIKLNGSDFSIQKQYDEEGEEIKLTSTERYIQLKDYMVRSEGMNNFIKEWILKVCKRNTLIPVSWDEQEQIIYDSLKDSGRKVVRINGQTPKSERSEILDNLEKEEDTIVIFKTKTLAEGISVNNVNYIVGYYLQKAYTTIVQAIGRSERLKKDGSIAMIFDFYTDIKKSEEHFKERKSYYDLQEIPVKMMEKEIKF